MINGKGIIGSSGTSLPCVANLASRSLFSDSIVLNRPHVFIQSRSESTAGRRSIKVGMKSWDVQINFNGDTTMPPGDDTQQTNDETLIMLSSLIQLSDHACCVRVVAARQR